jgi:hypothetical protein
MILLVQDTFTANDTIGMMKTFDNEEKLWMHLQKRAHLDRVSQRLENLEGKWRFSYYPYHTLADFREDSQTSSFAEMAAQACDQKRHLIVIDQGESKPFFLLATPELDTVKLKQEWCRAYAKSHRLLIVRE